ncbi:MAG TPA: phage head closure protein [Rhizomicrobium sp.]|jgi:SPP1 family predicted phage head-tail adaptor|nr:phage head closure protein [Rhizomicrobium sp.]
MLGTLNQRAQIYACAAVPDGGGGIGESWSQIATVWVRVEPITGSDVYGPDAVESRVRHSLTARRNAVLAAGNRAVVASRTFRIHAVLDEGAPAQLVTLLCEELP